MTEPSMVRLRHEGLHVSASEPHLDTLHATISEPFSVLKKRDSLAADCRAPSGALLRNKKTRAAPGPLARAFRKVFRSRTPSPSTDEREDEVNSESEEVKFEVSSDSESQDGLQVLTSPEVEECVSSADLPVLSRLNNNSLVAAPSEDSRSTTSSMKDFLPAQHPSLAKSQTYSALSEALHHAFLEGMIVSGAEDVTVLSNEDLHCQGSKSDNESGLSRSIEYSFSNKKSTSCVLSEVSETLTKNLEAPQCHSLLVPTVSNRSSTYSEPSDVCTDDEYSSQQSQEEKQPTQVLPESELKGLLGTLFSSRRPSCVPASDDYKAEDSQQNQEDKQDLNLYLESEPKSILGNLFGSRRPSCIPPGDDLKTEDLVPPSSPKFKPGKDGSSTPSLSDQVKGHKKLGDKLSRVAEVSYTVVVISGIVNDLTSGRVKR